MGWIDSTDAQRNGLTPVSFRRVGMYNGKLSTARKINVEMPFVFAEVGCPYLPVKFLQGSIDQGPVHQIGGVPDVKSRRVRKSGVGEVVIVAHADRARVW